MHIEPLERNKTIFVILTALLLYLPLTFLGNGLECGYYDSYGVIRTAKTLIQQHKYAPSRYPGCFVYELITALLFMAGGQLLSNFGTLIISLVIVNCFIMICRYHDVPHKHLLAIFMVVNPLYYVASTFTIDYLWALAFLLIGYVLLIKKRYFLAGIFWALAIGCRMSSILFVPSVLLAYFLTKEPDRNKALLSAGISVILGAVFFIPAFLHAGGNFGFFYYPFCKYNFFEHLIRFVYKNIYFCGLQTCIVFLFLFPFIIKGLKEGCASKYKNAVLMSILIIIVFEIMFFEVPWKKHYLLPVLPFTLILIGVSLKRHKWAIILLIIAQFSYNFININIGRPNVPNYATAFEPGLWLEPGYLINDISERIRMQPEILKWGKE